jgi:hypothetical protein
VAALVGFAASMAGAEVVQRGDLVVSLGGAVVPRKLPRREPVPVSVALRGEAHTADGAPLPRLARIELDLAGSGKLDTRGLAVCHRGQLLSASPAEALAACDGALVGQGRLEVEVFLEDQAPFTFDASLRAFNGRGRGGARLVWLHVFGADPPSSIVLAFHIRHTAGAFPTALVARVPADLGPAPHLARFQMTLGRRFAYRGRSRSYLSADCPLPPRFTAGIFPFARARYSFVDGESATTTIVRGCRVRGGRRG